MPLWYYPVTSSVNDQGWTWNIPYFLFIVESLFEQSRRNFTVKIFNYLAERKEGAQQNEGSDWKNAGDMDCWSRTNGSAHDYNIFCFIANIG